MIDRRSIAPNFSVTGQLSPEDMEPLSREGFRSVINNRPDGEGGPDQPSSDACRAAAEAADLSYHYLPLTGETLTEDLVDRFDEALQAAEGPVIAHCQSGMRSVLLWALAQTRRHGRPVEEVLETAANGGFDLNHLRPLFERFSGR